MYNIKLSIVIVSYNNQDVLEACLNSIIKNNDINNKLEIIVVEQSPTDDIFNFLKSDYKDIKVIRAKNNGFGAGNNIGIKYSKGKYLLLLNPDTVIVDPVFKFCIDKFDNNPNLGMFGVKLLNANFQDNSSFENIISFGFIPKIIKKVCHKLDIFISNKMYIQGADMFIRKDLFEDFGGFDESIFMYGEEIDLTMHILKRKCSIGYFKEKRIIHLEGACTPKNFEIKYEHQLHALKRIYKKHNLNFDKYIKKELNYQKFKKMLLIFLRQKNKENYYKTIKRLKVLNDI